MLKRSSIFGSCGIMRVSCSSIVKDKHGRSRQLESVIESKKESEKDFKEILTEYQEGGKDLQ